VTGKVPDDRNDGRELAVFDDPFGEEPNEETAYLFIQETDAADGEMNSQPKRPLVDVDIVGKCARCRERQRQSAPARQSQRHDRDPPRWTPKIPIP
jgi:hypothetical protein